MLNEESSESSFTLVEKELWKNIGYHNQGIYETLESKMIIIGKRKTRKSKKKAKKKKRNPKTEKKKKKKG